LLKSEWDNNIYCRLDDLFELNESVLMRVDDPFRKLQKLKDVEVRVSLILPRTWG
jgi:hypothetical protein